MNFKKNKKYSKSLSKRNQGSTDMMCENPMFKCGNKGEKKHVIDLNEVNQNTKNVLDFDEKKHFNGDDNELLKRL